MMPAVAWLAAIQGLDEQILMLVRGSPPLLVPVFYVATIVGGGWGMLAFVPFAWARATRAPTLWLLLTLTVNSALVSLLKAIFARARPCDALGWCAPVWVRSPGGHSFPSGHAAGAFAFAAFLSTLAPRYSPLLFAFAIVVAASRSVLGVHYPSDVIAGALLGALVGHAFARVHRSRHAASA